MRLPRSCKLQGILFWLWKKKKKSGILHKKVNKNSKACLYLIIPIGGRRTRILKGKINRICIQVQDRVEKGTKSISHS